MSERHGNVHCGRPCGVYSMAYREWGDPTNPSVVLCVHGLTRNSRDFAPLATRLAAQHRVVAVDVLGRGGSAWLRDPSGYAIPLYVQDMLVLIARLGVDQLAWVGTSMGGLIGMALACLPGNPIKRLVLNDVGPVLDRDAIGRIASYVGKPLAATDRDGACAELRAISDSFGPHDDAEWADLNDTMLMPNGAGGWQLNYDPGIAHNFGLTLAQPLADLWPLYDAITCPTLVLRGEQSDLLSADTLTAMTQRGPQAQTHTFAGVGHAPTLRHTNQASVVARFLTPNGDA